MIKKPFRELFDYLPKSRVKASHGKLSGKYPFYTSSNQLSKYIDDYDYTGNCLIFGTGGSPSVHYQEGKFSTTTDCIVARPKSNVEIFTKYCFQYLAGNMRILEAGFRGAGLKHISKRYISKINIPIPPLEDQLRISNILNEAETLIVKRKESLRLLDELLKNTFLEMFGDPVRNKEKWPLIRVSKFSESRLGKMLDQKQFTGRNLKPYLRNTNVLWFKFDCTELLEMDFDEREQLEFSLQIGDILMCEGGEIGRCAIWKGEMSECYFQKAIHRIRLNMNLVLPAYFVFMFWHYANNGGLIKYMGAATISHLTGKKLKKMNLPIPPIKLQSQFSKIVDNVEVLQFYYQASLDELENLYSSLSQRAFKGKLDLNRVKIQTQEYVEEVEEKDEIVEKKEQELVWPSVVKDRILRDELNGRFSYIELKNVINEMPFEKKPSSKEIQEFVISLLESKPPFLEQVFDVPDSDLNKPIGEQKKIMFRVIDEN